VFRLVERHSNVGLGGEVVHLIRVDAGEQRDQAGAVTEVAIVQEHSGGRVVRVDIEMVDTRGVEGRSPANQAVHFVALAQQELRKI
jgi:hypothetical protein